MAVVALTLAGCPEDGDFTKASLSPYPNPFGEGQPGFAAQPARDKPLEIVVDRAGTAFVSLQGTPDRPGSHVVALAAATGEVVAKIEVGSSPTGLALHPTAGLLVVLNRFSNFVSVIDTAQLEVVQSLPTDFYATEAVWSPDGRRLYITNRWRDAVEIWDVSVDDGKLDVTARRPSVVAVGSNPRDLAINADGTVVAVAALTGMTLSLIDTATNLEINRIDVGAPVNDVVFAGDFVIVATLSAATHHLPFAGPDTNGDGHPGDGTPNVNFQDLQNELAVYRLPDGAPVARYTSDTICCRDYRDVDPADVARHGELLPDPSTWIVGGALPEQLAVGPRVGRTMPLYVTYSASNQVQRFTVDLDAGTLAAGAVWASAGHNPHGIFVAGDSLLVSHRLGETVAARATETGETRWVTVVGDVSGGPFPSTDAEIGELFNDVTAAFSVDGDQSCAHCHREGGNIDKAFSMPLTKYAGVGLRMTMDYRGSADTRPWFFESAMDETNFKPVINEFARIENFCCSDYTLWGGASPAGCAQAPPAECEASNTSSADGFAASRAADRAPFSHPRPTAYASRDAFFVASAEAVIGRARSFGDGLYFEDPITGARRDIELDFNGLTSALGLFLQVAPRLLPNPNPKDLASVRRGRALFNSPTTGCAVCHPPPTFAVSTDVNPLSVPLRMGPVVTPMRAADGTNLDLFASGFMDTFPQTEMETCEAVCGESACAGDQAICDHTRNVAFGVPSLRGIWDRAPSMLHDGRAQGLREVLCTPDHPALLEGERGFNERDGVPDTHGGVSHLSAAEIADLIRFISSL